MVKSKLNLQLENFRDANAFAVMAEFRRAAKRAGWSPTEVDRILTKAKSKDYTYLLQTLMDYCE